MVDVAVNEEKQTGGEVEEHDEDQHGNQDPVLDETQVNGLKIGIT